MKRLEYNEDNNYEEYVNINPTFRLSNENGEFIRIPEVLSISYDNEAKLFTALERNRGSWSRCSFDVEAFQLFINQCQEFLDEVKNG